MRNWLPLFSLLLACQYVHAQDANTANSKSAWEFGIHGGALLPKRIPGVTEVMNTWGTRISMPSGKGTFEFDYFNGRGDGSFYHSFAFDYRFDFMRDIAPLHALVGFRLDQWGIEGGKSYLGGGWHFGGGNTVQLSGPFYFRADFKYRMSPGQSLDVSLGILYRLGASEN